MDSEETKVVKKTILEICELFNIEVTLENQSKLWNILKCCYIGIIQLTDFTEMVKEYLSTNSWGIQ